MVYSTSFQPPALPVTNSGRPPWILLDKIGYISDCVNVTRAEASTSTGQPIRVCFFTAEPPSVSYFSVDCPGLRKEDFAEEPRIVHSADNVALVSLSLNNPYSRTEYFIYRAKAEHQPPSLQPLPAVVDRYLSKLEDLPKASVAFVPYGSGEHFVLAALGKTFEPGKYKLHVFRSELGTWTDQPLLFAKSERGAHRIIITPVKVIMLGGGEIGWVDLCNGILVCNVLNDDAAPRIIPLPKLLPSNLAYIRQCSAQHFRDLICTTDGLIKLVEMEICYMPILPKTTDVSETEVLYDSELRLGEFDNEAKITYESIGWKAITWERTVSSNCWRRGCLVHVDDVLVNNPRHHLLLPDLVDKIALRDLLTSFPTLSMDGGVVAYFMSKVKEDDRKAWVVAVDMGKKTVEELLPTSAERFMYSNPTYVQCTLSRYLNTDTGNYCADDCLSIVPPTKKGRF